VSALRLGTRRSPLALAQSGQVADSLRSAGHDVDLVEITTDGDRSQNEGRAVVDVGVGVFVTALREALRSGEVDLAVHSAKDLPTAQPEDLILAAVPLREDPRDALCGAELAQLGVGARVGTGSPRRAAQLRALGLGLEVVAIRGNVGTRLGRIGTDVDAVVLARAGLARLGLLDAVAEVLDPLQMLPAAGQGALAVECRADGPVELLSPLQHSDSRLAMEAERALLAGLQAGCTAPVGALAEVCEGEDALEVYLRAVVVTQDGSVVLRRSITGSANDPEALGRGLAEELLADGASEVMENR
jgi:hydroxymethylbilane synthase